MRLCLIFFIVAALFIVHSFVIRPLEMIKPSIVFTHYSNIHDIFFSILSINEMNVNDTLKDIPNYGSMKR